MKHLPPRTAALALLPLVLASCQNPTPTGDKASMDILRRQPLTTKPYHFGDTPGLTLFSAHYRISTTVRDPLYQHLLISVLEAAYTRSQMLNAGTQVTPPGGFFDCYVFGDRPQWELYTKLHTGPYADTYLQISAGGYSQEGVFAGYNINRDTTLSVIAHEAWHQYSWFAFKDHLPSWLEEGIATQNEHIDWDGATPSFAPELNFHRYQALQAAVREHRLWALRDLTTTHAGDVVKLSQKYVDSYYAQVWALALFLENSGEYRPKLIALLKHAREGTLHNALEGAGLTSDDLTRATIRWNAIAGPRYLTAYIDQDLFQLEKKYVAFMTQLSSNWPPKIK